MDQGKLFNKTFPRPQLCEICNQIPFVALSCPSLSDLEKAREARKKNKRILPFLPLRENGSANNAFDATTVALGSINRIQRNIAHCQLCSMIYGVLERQGFVISDNVPIPRNNEVALFAITDMLYYGYITDSPMDVEGRFADAYFLLRRLSIKAEFVSNPSTPFAYFDYFAQPCRIGACLNSNDDAIQFPFKPTKSDQMLFGGRKRPKKVNLGRLLNWVYTCESQHEMTCQLQNEQLNEMQ